MHGRGQLADLQGERRLLERFLHRTATEWSEIAAALRRTTVTVFGGEFGECRLTGRDLFSISCKYSPYACQRESAYNVLRLSVWKREAIAGSMDTHILPAREPLLLT